MQQIAQLIVAVFASGVAATYTPLDYSKVPELVKANHAKCMKDAFGASADIAKRNKDICDKTVAVQNDISKLKDCQSPLIVPQLQKTIATIRTKLRGNSELAIFQLNLFSGIVKAACVGGLSDNGVKYINENDSLIADFVAAEVKFANLLEARRS